MRIYAITTDFVPNWSYIRNADVMPNRKDIRNNCGYNMLYEIARFRERVINKEKLKEYGGITIGKVGIECFIDTNEAHKRKGGIIR